MNWKMILAAMSGPISAALRYGVATLGTIAATKWGIDGDTIAAVSAGVLAAAAALMGILTATPGVKIESTAALPSVASVRKTDGSQVTAP